MSNLPSASSCRRKFRLTPSSTGMANPSDTTSCQQCPYVQERNSSRPNTPSNYYSASSSGMCSSRPPSPVPPYPKPPIARNKSQSPLNISWPASDALNESLDTNSCPFSPRPAACSTAVKCDRKPATATTSSSKSDDTCSATTARTRCSEQFKIQVSKLTKPDLAGGSSCAIVQQLNEVYLDRLRDIDCHGDGDAVTKVATYKEWVDALLHVNKTLLNNMHGLEGEIEERLKCLQDSSQPPTPCEKRPPFQPPEIWKYRQDIQNLLKLIQNGYHNDCWSLQDMTFLTIKPEQIFGDETRSYGGKCCQETESGTDPFCIRQETEKMLENIRALAHEVAEKHDEIRQLRSQMSCLEDEIQNAQKKIQLKDNVVKELRCGEREKADVIRQLDCLKSQINTLSNNFNPETETNCEPSQTDPSYCAQVEKEICIIENVRTRLKRLAENSTELKKELQNRDFELAELRNHLEAERHFANTNGIILKEIAELLSVMTGENISYTHIYNDECQSNPFADGILRLSEKYSECQNRISQSLKNAESKIRQMEDLLKLSESQTADNEAIKYANERLQQEVETLQQSIEERDEKINNLNIMMNRVCLQTRDYLLQGESNKKEIEDLTEKLNCAERKAAEFDKELENTLTEKTRLQNEIKCLNHELEESQLVNQQLSNKVCRLEELLKAQEEHRMEINRKYNDIQDDFALQAKKLLAVTTNMEYLQRLFDSLEKKCEDNDAERQMLRDEIVCLKTKEAQLEAAQKFLEEKLTCTEQELRLARGCIRDTRNELEHAKSEFQCQSQNLNKLMNDIKLKYNDLVDDYARLQDEYSATCYLLQKCMPSNCEK